MGKHAATGGGGGWFAAVRKVLQRKRISVVGKGGEDDGEDGDDQYGSEAERAAAVEAAASVSALRRGSRAERASVSFDLSSSSSSKGVSVVGKGVMRMGRTATISTAAEAAARVSALRRGLRRSAPPCAFRLSTVATGRVEHCGRFAGSCAYRRWRAGSRCGASPTRYSASRPTSAPAVSPTSSTTHAASRTFLRPSPGRRWCVLLSPATWRRRSRRALGRALPGTLTHSKSRCGTAVVAGESSSWGRSWRW